MEHEVVQNGADAIKYLGAAIATFGALGGAIGVGMIGGAAVNGVARNPGAEGKIRSLALLAMALAEGLGVISLVIGLCLAFVV